jgi:hypothetical protein
LSSAKGTGWKKLQSKRAQRQNVHTCLWFAFGANDSRQILGFAAIHVECCPEGAAGISEGSSRSSVGAQLQRHLKSGGRFQIVPLYSISLLVFPALAGKDHIFKEGATDSLIQENSGGYGDPVRKNVPNGEKASEQKHARNCHAEGVECRRMAKLEELH